jgi:hypothetical protein
LPARRLEVALSAGARQSARRAAIDAPGEWAGRLAGLAAET